MGGGSRACWSHECTHTHVLLQVLDFPEAQGPKVLTYDPEWLAILLSTAHLSEHYVEKFNSTMPSLRTQYVIDFWRHTRWIDFGDTPGGIDFWRHARCYWFWRHARFNLARENLWCGYIWFRTQKSFGREVSSRELVISMYGSNTSRYL